MNIKYNKKGITLLTLTITIVVSLILISVTALATNDIFNNTKKSEFAKEIYTIQNLVKEYKFKENKYPVNGEMVLNLSTIDTQYREQFSSETGYSTGSITLKYIDLYEAGVENTKRGLKENSDNTDVYLLSENTNKLYYLKGQKIDENIYYTLTDDLKQIIGVRK